MDLGLSELINDIKYLRITLDRLDNSNSSNDPNKNESNLIDIENTFETIADKFLDLESEDLNPSQKSVVDNCKNKFEDCKKKFDEIKPKMKS